MRFTIRDLLWLTVVVGMGAAWWLDRQQLHEQAARLKMDLYMSRAVDDVN